MKYNFNLKTFVPDKDNWVDNTVGSMVILSILLIGLFVIGFLLAIGVISI